MIHQNLGRELLQKALPNFWSRILAKKVLPNFWFLKTTNGRFGENLLQNPVKDDQKRDRKSFEIKVDTLRSKLGSMRKMRWF